MDMKKYITLLENNSKPKEVVAKPIQPKVEPQPTVHISESYEPNPVVRKIVRNVMEKKTPEPPKPRNPVAKNANAAVGGGGAGKHKDRKKDAKQGVQKHKGQQLDEYFEKEKPTDGELLLLMKKYRLAKISGKPLASVMRQSDIHKLVDAERSGRIEALKYKDSIDEKQEEHDDYEPEMPWDSEENFQDMDSEYGDHEHKHDEGQYDNQGSTDKGTFKRRELEHELGHEGRSGSVYIDGRYWKTFDDYKQAQNVARSLERKGKNATVRIHEMYKPPSPAQKRFNRALEKQRNSPENTADRESHRKRVDAIMPPKKDEPVKEKMRTPFAGAAVGQKEGPAGQLKAMDPKGYPKGKLVGGALEEGKVCPQCGSSKCSCPPGKCKCKPVAGFKPKMSEDKDPCWKNYKMVGTKKKGSKTVPNCVPKEGREQGVAEARVDQLPTKGADYSKYDTDHLKMMLRPGILHRNEAGFKALIRKELKKREQQSQQGVAEGSLEEVDRRGFLKGVGAAAVAGAAGGVATKANAQQVSQWVKYATDLATKSMGRIHQDTGYDLRNWLVVNVSNWVTDYCTKTNSYNAKEVIDYCNQQGLEASGLDKQHALVTAFLTNMKNRYQDFLSAYRAGINESFQKFNAAVQSQEKEKNVMGNLSREEFDVLLDALIIYAICKDRQLDNSELFRAVAASIKRFIDANNAKDYVNSIYPKARQSVEVLKNNPDIYQKESSQFFKNAGNTIAKLDNISSNKKPEFESVNQGVAEGSLNEGQYEMMMRNGQVKKFIAKDDADAKRIAAGHGAKSVIKLRGGVPAGKIAEQGVAEGGPFSYGKPPRKGSVAANAAQQRKEQEKNKPPIEPKDQKVGVAKVTKDVKETQLDELDRPSGKLYIIITSDNAGAPHVFGDFGSFPQDVMAKVSKRGTRDKSGAKTKLKIDFLFDDFRTTIHQLRAIFRDVDFVGAEAAEFIIKSSALRSDQGEDVKHLKDYIESGDDRRMKMYQAPEDDEEEGEPTGGNILRIDPNTGAARRVVGVKPQTQMGGKSAEQPGMTTYRFKDPRFAQQLRGMNLGFNIKGDSITVDQKQKQKLVSMLGNKFSQVFANKELFKEGGDKYKIKSTGSDINPATGKREDYYISSTGKKVYKAGVKKGDHENPKSGEVKKQVKEFKMSLPPAGMSPEEAKQFAADQQARSQAMYQQQQQQQQPLPPGAIPGKDSPHPKTHKYDEKLDAWIPGPPLMPAMEAKPKSFARAIMKEFGLKE